MFVSCTQAAKAILDDTEPVPSVPLPKSSAEDFGDAAAVARIKDSLFAMFSMPAASDSLYSVNQDQLTACVSAQLLTPPI